MSELVTARIRANATRLGLPGIAADPAALAARAEQATLGYLDFLDLALGEETGLKDSRRARAALNSSGLPHRKTLDEFDFAFQPPSTSARSATWPPWLSFRTRPTSRC